MGSPTDNVLMIKLQPHKSGRYFTVVIFYNKIVKNRKNSQFNLRNNGNQNDKKFWILLTISSLFQFSENQLRLSHFQ